MRRPLILLLGCLGAVPSAAQTTAEGFYHHGLNEMKEKRSNIPNKDAENDSFYIEAEYKF